MSKRLFVGGLPYEMTEEKLQELFSACGRVEKIKIMFDRATGRSKGFGFIEMATDLEGAAAILKLDGSMLGTRRISVKEAKPAENRRGDNHYNGRPSKDNRPRENRFSSDAGNNHPRNRFGDPAHARPNSFDPSANSRGSGGPQRREGSYGHPGKSSGANGSSGRGYGESRGQGLSSRIKSSSDWRSELGIGINQRKDFRRTSREHHRDRNHQHHDHGDNFGNR